LTTKSGIFGNSDIRISSHSRLPLSFPNQRVFHSHSREDPTVYTWEFSPPAHSRVLTGRRHTRRPCNSTRPRRRVWSLDQRSPETPLSARRAKVQLVPAIFFVERAAAAALWVVQRRRDHVTSMTSSTTARATYLYAVTIPLYAEISVFFPKVEG